MKFSGSNVPKKASCVTSLYGNADALPEVQMGLVVLWDQIKRLTMINYLPHTSCMCTPKIHCDFFVKS